MTRPALLGLAVLAVGALVAVLTRDPDERLDAERAATQVERAVAADTGQRLSLRCPADVPARAGERFTCRGRGAGQPVRVEVTLVGDGRRFRVTRVTSGR